MDSSTSTALTDDERETFNTLVGIIGGHVLDELIEGVRLALMRVQFDGQPASAVVVVDSRGEDAGVRPLALLMSDDLFSRMEQPSGEDF